MMQPKLQNPIPSWATPLTHHKCCLPAYKILAHAHRFPSVNSVVFHSGEWNQCRGINGNLIGCVVQGHEMSNCGRWFVFDSISGRFHRLKKDSGSPAQTELARRFVTEQICPYIYIIYIFHLFLVWNHGIGFSTIAWSKDQKGQLLVFTVIYRDRVLSTVKWPKTTYKCCCLYVKHLIYHFISIWFLEIFIPH